MARTDIHGTRQLTRRDCLKLMLAVGGAGVLAACSAPALAESWSQPKPTTWEFKLRKGVSFHDGTPWNAAAMKFNIERVLDPATKSTQQSLFQVIKQIEVVDDYTIHLTTEAPNATLPI